MESASRSLETSISSPDQTLSSKKSPRNVQFEKELLSFLLKEWKEPTYVQQLKRRLLYVSNWEECHILKRTGRDKNKVTCLPIQELECNYEEADSQLLLNTLHADNHSSSTVVIKYPDTDFAVIAVQMSHSIPVHIFRNKANTAMYQSDKQRSQSWQRLCKALIGYHTFTGCDSESAFVGHGKSQGIKLSS